ncbi:MAG: HIT family protein [Myxococcota bacterium]
MSASDCIFCAIVAGLAPAARVFDDDDCLAFMDIQPLARGHVLVIPKRHAENLFDLETDEAAAVARTAKQLAHALRTVLEPEGLRLFQLNGAAAGQTVFHYHMHLLPRNADEPDVNPAALHGRKPADRAELEELAGRIRTALDSHLVS